MGARYRNTFYSIAGVQWQLDICDVAYSVTPTVFNTEDPGFQLQHKPLTERLDTMFASTVSIPFVVANSTDASFITEMMQSQEERFTLKVYRNSSLYWAGILLSDLVSFPDENYPYTITITFTDGLGRLKDIDYNTGGTTPIPYTGKETLLNHVLRCLEKSGSAAMYGDNDTFLKTIVNWYDQTHYYYASQCPLAYTRVNNAVFYYYDENAQVTYKTAADVLDYILRMFNARIFQSEGIWYFLQVQDYARPQTISRTFKKGGALITYSSIQDFRITPTNAQRKNGGMTKYLGPLYSVSRTYKPKVTCNANGSFLPIQSKYETAVTFLNDVIPASAGSVSFTFTGMVHEWYRINHPSVPVTPIRTRYYIQVVKTKNSDLSKEYLKGNNLGGNPTVTTWTTNSSDVYSLDSMNKSGYDWHNWTEFNFTTPGITEDSTITFKMTVFNHYNGTGAVYTIGPNETWDYECIDFKALSSYNSALDNTKDIIFKAINTLSGGSSTASSTKLELPETIIGDGPYNYNIGALQTTANLSTWVQSANWRVHNTANTVNVPIHQLSVKQNLEAQRRPVEKYVGTFVNTLLRPASSWVWTNRVFVPLAFTLDPMRDEVTGEWFNVIQPAY